MRRSAVRHWRWSVPDESLVTPCAKVGVSGSISGVLWAGLALEDVEESVREGGFLRMGALALQLQTRCSRLGEGA